MIYRKVAIEDLNPISELFNAYRVFYKKENDIDAAKEFINDRITNKDSEIFIAENSNNEIIGFVQLYSLFSSTRMKKLWLLNDLFVNPKHRGKGVSVGLINKAKELVIKTKACGMFLETEKTNRIGNNLYPKTGFTRNEGSNFYEWNQ